MAPSKGSPSHAHVRESDERAEDASCDPGSDATPATSPRLDYRECRRQVSPLPWLAVETNPTTGNIRDGPRFWHTGKCDQIPGPSCFNDKARGQQMTLDTRQSATGTAVQSRTPTYATEEETSRMAHNRFGHRRSGHRVPVVRRRQHGGALGFIQSAGSESGGNTQTDPAQEQAGASEV